MSCDRRHQEPSRHPAAGGFGPSGGVWRARRALAGAALLPAAVALLLAAVARPLPAQSVAPDSPARPPAADCAHVRSLRLDRHDIYRADEAAGYVHARWANALHVTTRASVIRRGLRFRAGEEVCLPALEASLRRLRAYPFLHSDVRIDGFAPGDSVDLIVHTRDVWTTRPEIQLRKQGRLLTYAVGLRESNLFGLGRELAVGFGEDDVQPFWDLGYEDPQLLGTDLLLNATVARGGDRDVAALEIRPFALRGDSPWQLDVRANGLSGTYVDRRGGLEGPDSDLEYWRIVAAAGPRAGGGDNEGLWVMPAAYLASAAYAPRPAGARAAGAMRAAGAADSADLAVRPLEDGEIRALGLRAKWLRERYVQLRGVNTFEHIEDLNLGSDLSLQIGYSARALGAAEDGWFFLFQGRQGLPISARRFALAELTAWGEHGDAGMRDASFLHALRYYQRLDARQTLALRLRCDYGIDLRPQSVFTLGAESGLRGFEAYDFWGDRVVLLNLEDRLTFVEDFLGLVSLGGVVFADAGVAWCSGARERERPRVSGGAGLRLLGSRTSGRFVTRVDLGYPLLGAGDDGWVLSIGAGQAF